MRSKSAYTMLTLLYSAFSQAVPIGGFDVLDHFHFIDARQSNTAGLGVGTFDAVGLDLRPAAGTVVTATQGGRTGNVPFLFSPALPNQFFRSFSFNPALTGSYVLDLSNPAVNGGADASVTTRPLFSTTPPPFVNTVTLTGGGVTPTIGWNRPSGYVPNAQSVFIFDKTVRTPTGNATLILTANVAATANTFTIPTGVLQDGHLYTFSVQLDERHAYSDPLSSTLTGRSRSFVDFTTAPPDFTGSVLLPVVGVAPPLPPGGITACGVTGATLCFGAPFLFDASVSAGVPIVIDPIVAHGFEYRIDAGSPLVASVALPDLGDPAYDLYLWQGTDYVFTRTLAPNERFFFAGGGVDRFEIRGIDPNLLVDPENPLAFMTELTFVSSGQFKGSMTPLIIEFTPSVAVPEPDTLALVTIVIIAGPVAARRRKRAPATT